MLAPSRPHKSFSSPNYKPVIVAPTTVELILSVVTVFLPVAFPGDGDAERGACAAADLI